jgi:hypothetical protein
MEPPTQPIEVIEVMSVHGQRAQATMIELTSCQDVAVSLLRSFAREVADKAGVTWTQAHEDKARLLVGALVDAAEERMSDALIEVAGEMIAERQQD